MCVPACSTDPATAEIYTLSLHDALPICERILLAELGKAALDHLLDDVLRLSAFLRLLHRDRALALDEVGRKVFGDRKSTRLNSSHMSISYAVFCLKKKIYLVAIVLLQQH